MELLIRHRRLKRNEWSRNFTNECNLSPKDLIQPIFIHESKDLHEIKGMPGIFRYNISSLLKYIEKLVKLNISTIALFPFIQDDLKDNDGSYALNEKGLIPKAIKEVRKNFPDLGLFCDIALDPYTSHGHDGVVIDDEVDNDATLETLCQQALLYASVGCEAIAPSDMMDGRILAIREVLEYNDFRNVIVASYAVKYASALYGPFRDAVGAARIAKNKKSTLQNKLSYQLNPRNKKQALWAASIDEQSGADMIIVKPGLPYLDVLTEVAEKANVPVGVFQVSGEYSMIKFSANNGALDLEKAIIETLISFKRSGANFIWTYFAEEAAKYLNQQNY